MRCIKSVEKISRNIFRTLKLGFVFLTLSISACSSKPGSHSLDLAKLVLGEDVSIISSLKDELTNLNIKNDLSLAKVIELLENPNTKTTNLVDALKVVKLIEEINANLNSYDILKTSTEEFIIAIERQELNINPKSQQTDLITKRNELSELRHKALQHFLAIRSDAAKAIDAADSLKKFISDIFSEKLSSFEKISLKKYNSDFLSMVQISNSPDFDYANFDFSNLSLDQIQTLVINLEKHGRNINFIFFVKVTPNNLEENINSIIKISHIIEIITQSAFDLQNIKVSTFQYDANSGKDKGDTNTIILEDLPSILMQINKK